MNLTEQQRARAIAEAEKFRRPMILLLMGQICEAMGVSVRDLRSKRKSKPLVMAARVQFAICAREQGYSYPEIGMALARHHTTVMHMLGERRR